MAVVHIPDGTNYADAIRGLVREALPDVSFDMTPTDLHTDFTLVYDDLTDPWAEAELLATVCGMRLRLQGDRAVVRIPLRQKLENWRWQYITKPVRDARQRLRDRLDPPIEWPDPRWDD